MKSQVDIRYAVERLSRWMDPRLINDVGMSDAELSVLIGMQDALCWVLDVPPPAPRSESTIEPLLGPANADTPAGVIAVSSTDPDGGEQISDFLYGGLPRRPGQ